MPTIVRWIVRTALVYFVLALLVGVAVAAGPALDLRWMPAGLMPVYLHLFMVGWVTFLIIGVAHWMFPKFTMQQPRGRDWLAWTSYGLINAGLILRAIGEPGQATNPAPMWGWMLVISAVLQWLGGLAFAFNAWTRVKVK